MRAQCFDGAAGASKLNVELSNIPFGHRPLYTGVEVYGSANILSSLAFMFNLVFICLHSFVPVV